MAGSSVPKTHKVLLASTILTGMVFSVLMSLATPTYQAPDERMHDAYILSVAHGKLPILTAEKVTQESYHPPLYYALAQPVQWIVSGWSERNRVLALRMVGVALIWVVAVCGYAMVKTLFPDRPTLALGAAVFASLHPQLLFMQGVINNDTLANPLGALGLLLFVRMILRTTFARRMVVFSMLCCAALFLTKALLWPIAFALGIATLVRILQAHQWKDCWWLAIPALAVAWWFGRNLVLYGDLTSLSLQRTLWYETLHRDFRVMGGVSSWFRNVVESFWARFGYFTIAPPAVWYRAVKIWTVLCALGAGFFLIQYWAKFSRAVRVALLGLTLLALVTLAFVFLYSFVFYQAQGRFFLPLLTVFTFGCALAIEQLAPQRIRLAVLLLIIVAYVALNVASVTAITKAT